MIPPQLGHLSFHSTQSRSLCHISTSSRAEAQLLDEDVCRLLSHRQCSVISVGSNVTRDDTKISNLQPLDPIDTQARIDDSVLLPGQHLAGAKRMPGRSHVVTQPLLKHIVVVCRVLDLRGVIRQGPVSKLNASGFGLRREGRMALFHLAAVAWHAANNLALLLVGPDVLLDIVPALVSKEAMLKVERVA